MALARHLRNTAPVLIVPALVLACWQALSVGGFVPAYLLPSPESVWKTLVSYIAGNGGDAYAGRFPGDLRASVGRVCGGFFLAILPGTALGLLSGRLPLLGRLLSPIINGIRAVPGICWLPLALLWLGIGFRATLFLIALAAFFPAYLNAAAGAAAVPPVLIQAGQMLGFSRAALFFRIILPSSMPFVRTGLRLALGTSFAYLVLGELTGVPDGIGAMIMDARLLGRADLIIAGIILIALLGWLCDRVLAWSVLLFLHWHCPVERALGKSFPQAAGGRQAISGTSRNTPACREPAPSMNGFFHCASVSKSFPTANGPQRVLRDASLALGQGEVLALLGASGCGKTTLLNILAGFLPPDGGEVRLEGRLCTGPGPDRAVVFQTPALFPWLTALENTEAGLKAVGMARPARRKLALDMLELVGLAGHAGKLPEELSGGMRQRVALARVLALSPKVLLVDEPFAALDAISREQMQGLLADLHQRLGMSILLVTHDVEEAVLLADAVCIMAAGQGLVGRYAVDRPRPRFRGDPELLPYRNMLRGRLRGEASRTM